MVFFGLDAIAWMRVGVREAIALQFTETDLGTEPAIALRRMKGDERSLKIPLFKQFGNKHRKSWNDRFTL